MNGPRYIQRNVYMLKNKEREYEQHMRKLGMIETRRPDKPVEEEEPLNEKLVKRKANLMRFQASEKYFNINRDNQVLLEKLVEISQGKWSSVTTKDMAATLSGGGKQTPKTLNSRFKKREAQRIAQENEAMAHRLVESHPIISHKRLEKDYKKILEAKKVMVRMTSTPKLSSSKGSKLPPLKTAQNFKPAKKNKSKSIAHKTADAEEIEHQQSLNDREPEDLGSPVEIDSPAKPRREEKKTTQKAEEPVAGNDSPKEEPKQAGTPVPSLPLDGEHANEEQPAQEVQNEAKENVQAPAKTGEGGENQEKSVNNGARASGRRETAGPGLTGNDQKEDFNMKAGIMKSVTLAPKKNEKNAAEALQKSPTVMHEKSLENPKSEEKVSQNAEKPQNEEPKSAEKKVEEVPEAKPEVKSEENQEVKSEPKQEENKVEQPAA